GFHFRPRFLQQEVQFGVGLLTAGEVLADIQYDLIVHGELPPRQLFEFGFRPCNAALVAVEDWYGEAQRGTEGVIRNGAGGGVADAEEAEPTELGELDAGLGRGGRPLGGQGVRPRLDRLLHQLFDGEFDLRLGPRIVGNQREGRLRQAHEVPQALFHYRDFVAQADEILTGE